MKKVRAYDNVPKVRGGPRTLKLEKLTQIFQLEVPLNTQNSPSPRPHPLMLFPSCQSPLTLFEIQMPVAWVIHSREWIPVSIQIARRFEPPVLNWGKGSDHKQRCDQGSHGAVPQDASSLSGLNPYGRARRTCWSMHTHTCEEGTHTVAFTLPLVLLEGKATQPGTQNFPRLKAP